MKELTITIKNDTGLHSRPADVFVRTAKMFESTISVKKGEKTANAKAILKIILLNVSQNDEITIISEGSDENEAIEELKKLVESDFETIHPSIEI